MCSRVGTYIVQLTSDQYVLCDLCLKGNQLITVCSFRDKIEVIQVILIIINTQIRVIHITVMC